MWNGKTLSVVLPTYNEKDSIAETIRAFDKLGIVDDILVGLLGTEPPRSLDWDVVDFIETGTGRRGCQRARTTEPDRSCTAA